MRGAVFLFAGLARRAAGVAFRDRASGFDRPQVFLYGGRTRTTEGHGEEKHGASREARPGQVRYQPLRSTPSRSKAVRLRILR
jgi:hypothetical protein